MASLEWEGKDHARRVYRECQEHPALVGKLDQQQILIEGDNLLSLSALAGTQSEFDFVYIDPPYNTGNTGWIYDDSMHVDTWLSFLYPRLALVRDLLCDHGVVMVSIGSDEYERLTLLMDEIFGRKNRVSNIIWKTKSASNNVQLISSVHEYILVYAKDKDALLKSGRTPWKTSRHGAEGALDFARNLLEDKALTHAERRDKMRAWYQIQIQADGGDAKAKARWKNMLNYSWFDDHGLYYPTDMSAPGADGPTYTIYDKDGREYPAPSRGWGLNSETLQSLIDEDQVHFRTDKDGKSLQPLKKIYLADKMQTVQTSILDIPVRGATLELERILGKKVQFPYPKPVALMKLILTLVCRDNDRILDVFAGSGSLMHAARSVDMPLSVIALEVNQEVLDQVFWPRMDHLRKTLGCDVPHHVRVQDTQDKLSPQEIVDRIQADWEFHSLEGDVEVRDIGDWNQLDLSLDQIQQRLEEFVKQHPAKPVPDWIETWMGQINTWLKDEDHRE